MSELKQIKRHHERQLKNIGKKLTMYQIHPADVDWLIKQAERVGELEEENNELAERVQDLKIMLKVLGRQTERYKQALEFYADPMIWREGNRIKGNTFEMPLANNDNGHKARKALEGRDNE